MQTLDDFKARGCLTPFSYTWLIFLTLIALGVFAADIFTAVQLLAFNRWSSEVQPAVPFNISKWIFAIAIILSVVLYGYEFIRAYRVVKRNSIAECYLDPTAAIWQSLRPGSGKGWRRFLVFAELTRSRKGVDYTAIFVYFQFKSKTPNLSKSGSRANWGMNRRYSNHCCRRPPRCRQCNHSLFGLTPEFATRWAKCTQRRKIRTSAILAERGSPCQ